MTPEVERVLIGIGNTILWTAVSIGLVVVVIELLNWRYHLLDEIFKENSAAASILAGSFVLGIFYAVVQIVNHAAASNNPKEHFYWYYTLYDTSAGCKNTPADPPATMSSCPVEIVDQHGIFPASGIGCSNSAYP